MGFTSACLHAPAPSSIFQSLRFEDTFHGPLLRSQHHNMIPFAKGRGGEPFSLRDSRIITKEVCERTLSKLSTYKILGPGMILLENYVSLKDQVDIVNMCDKWGALPMGFCDPPFTAGEDYRIYMSFGRNWDPKTKHKNRYRSDGSEPPAIPYQLFSLAKDAIEDAQAHLDDLPSMCPDTCLVSFYPIHNGRTGLYSDRHESSFYSVHDGLPVVSISIGEAAKFVYLTFEMNESLESVLLRSGDVLIYGGKSRMISTEMSQIHGDTMPEPLLLETGLKSGWLNLTLKNCDHARLS